MTSHSSAPLPPRVLVRGVNWIGDTVMMMPAVQRLREAMPHDGHLAIYVSDKVAPLWKNNPHITETITPPPHVSDFIHAREIKKRHFGLAVIFPNSFRSALIPFLARIPRRVGYHGHSRQALLTESFPSPKHFQTQSPMTERAIRKLAQKRTLANAAPAQHAPFRHQVFQHLELVGKVGANTSPCPPQIYLSKSEKAETVRFFPDDGRPVIGVAPSAEFGPAKRWPMDQFVETLRIICSRVDCRIILCGSSDDRPYCKELGERVTAANREATIDVIAGKTTLRELCACLARCKVVLTNDTGPMHLAAAVGTKVVGIFGSTEPSLTGPNYPGGDAHHAIIRHTVECSPCFLRECPIDFRCMRKISVEEVVTAVLTQL